MPPKTPNNQGEVNIITTHSTPPTTEACTCTAWYTPLCRVTKTSKILAAIIFIAMPFLGGYVGYNLAKVHSATDSVSAETSRISDTSLIDVTEEIVTDTYIHDSALNSITSEQMKVGENALDLFNNHFSSKGKFEISNVTPSALYGQRLNFKSGVPDLKISGTVKVEFNYHYDSWMTIFTPDEISMLSMPILKDSKPVSFMSMTDDYLCKDVFKCKSEDEIRNDRNIYTSPIYETKVALLNPTLGYEVVPSDAGTPTYTISFEKLEVLP